MGFPRRGSAHSKDHQNGHQRGITKTGKWVEDGKGDPATSKFPWLCCLARQKAQRYQETWGRQMFLPACPSKTWATGGLLSTLATLKFSSHPNMASFNAILIYVNSVTGKAHCLLWRSLKTKGEIPCQPCISALFLLKIFKNRSKWWIEKS